MAEPARAYGEWATSFGLLPFMSLLPAGDGHPVLVLPGFTASDSSTNVLRRFLRTLGYQTHGWGLGRNMGPTARVVSSIPELIHRLSDESGEKISIIGWSLGGIYARHEAARAPSRIRQLITLATPVSTGVREVSNASPLFDALQAIHVPGHPMLDDGEPLDVPVTAVHTRSDAIVPWQSCLVQEAPNAENLRVRGSHSGLGFNPAVVYLIADRLSQEEDTWEPFQPPLPYRRIITKVVAT